MEKKWTCCICGEFRPIKKTDNRCGQQYKHMCYDCHKNGAHFPRSVCYRYTYGTYEDIANNEVNR